MKKLTEAEKHDIYMSLLADESMSSVAYRYGISTKRVGKIAAEIEKERFDDQAPHR